MKRIDEGSDLPDKLAQPARRALAGAGYSRLEQLAQVGEDEVKRFHGIGPNALNQIREALAAKGLAFAGNGDGNGPEQEVRAVYRRLLEGWNNRDAEAMAEPFAEDWELIGYDGSRIAGKSGIVSHLSPIFASHPTPAYIAKVKEVRLLAPDVALLRAIAGMVPSGQTDLNPGLNTHQTLVCVHKEPKGWVIALFQNTPAQFHGRPDLAEQMTEELRRLLP